jgi:hypothetical protein
MSTENTGASAPSSTTSNDSSTQIDTADTSAVSDGSNEASSDTHGHASEAEIEADPTLSKQEKKEAKKALKELEIKFNGKTEKVALPFEISEEHAEWMRRQLQMSKMAHVSKQEQAQLEREVLGFLQELKQNPRKALSNPAYGVDLKQIAKEILEEEIRNSQKTPEELEQEKYEAERKAFLEEKKQYEEEKKKRERDAVIEKAAQEYDIAMSSALDKFDIPKTPLAIHKMAQYMSYEIERGFEPDMELIASKVEDDMAKEYRDYVKSMSHEKRLKYLGEEIFEDDRKARVAKMKKAPPTAKQITKDVQKPEPKKEEPVKKLTFKERFGI